MTSNKYDRFVSVIDCKNDNACILGFNDFWLRMIGIPIISLILPFVFFDNDLVNGFPQFTICVGVSLIYTLIYWQTDRLTLILFRRKFPNYSDYRKRLFLQSIVILLITAGLCSLLDLLTNSILRGVLPANQAIPYPQALLASIVITIIVVSIYETKYAFDLFKKELVSNEELKKENVQSQLQALKNQVNPHFLFNSLNTLASVIPENPSLAVTFVENLSMVYRYILEIKDKDLVSLEEEMKCVEAYKYLLQIRFGENIQFEKSGINGNKNYYVIPLSIQMLVENAIKHNIVSKSKPLKIEISANNNFISVKNNLQLKTTVETSTQTGLENIDSRYEMLTKHRIEVKKSSELFEVILPLIQIGTAR